MYLLTQIDLSSLYKYSYLDLLCLQIPPYMRWFPILLQPSAAV